jgi:DNA-binding CsgD family transcriptional regulator
MPGGGDDDAAREIALLVRGATLRHFVDHGHAPAAEHIRRTVGVTQAELVAALTRLNHPSDVVLAPGSSSIVVARPFSTERSGYQATCRGQRYWTACAQDALMLGFALDSDMELDTLCPDCDEPIHVELRGGKAYGDAVVHCLVPMSHIYDNISFACATTLFFRDADHARRWCDQRGYELGAIATLDQYAAATEPLSRNRLNVDYVRPDDHTRDAAYDAAGLTSDFWKLRRVPARAPDAPALREDGHLTLTSREREVLERLCAGLSKKQIAAALELSVHTIDTHVRNIYTKLGVRSRAAAVAASIRLRLV